MSKVVYDDLILYYATSFNKAIEVGKDPYYLLSSTVLIILLSELYRKFIRDGIPTLESLPKEQKEKFWIKAKRYCTEENKNKDRIKASQAAYVLTLITSTE